MLFNDVVYQIHDWIEQGLGLVPAVFVTGDEFPNPFRKEKVSHDGLSSEVSDRLHYAQEMAVLCAKYYPDEHEDSLRGVILSRAATDEAGTLPQPTKDLIDLCRNQGRFVASLDDTAQVVSEHAGSDAEVITAATVEELISRIHAWLYR